MGLERDSILVEAALYAREGFLSLKEIREILKTSSDTYVEKVLENLKEKLERGSPFRLVRTGSSVSLRLRDDYLSKLQGIIPKVRLSKGILKTLSLIAYKQPVFQSELVKMRGKRVYDHLRLLTMLGFVESKPYARTRILRTTQKFSSYFGLEGDIESIPLELAREGGIKTLPRSPQSS